MKRNFKELEVKLTNSKLKNEKITSKFLRNLKT